MRWFARLRAWIGGYFWLPCPVCDRMFAGFECTGHLRTPIGEPDQATCHRCPGEWVFYDGKPRRPALYYTGDGDLAWILFDR